MAADFSVALINDGGGGGGGGGGGNGGSGAGKLPPAPTYETVVWSMPSPFDGVHATYKQNHVARVTGENSPNLNALDSSIPTTCGTQYQVDVYVEKFTTSGNNPVLVDNTGHLNNLYTDGLAGPDGAQDGTYLAGANGNPGTFGLGSAWKFVQRAACTPPPCVQDSTVSYTYDATNNSGVITVPDPTGSSGVLCTPFYVTAASWTYDDQGSMWPQTLHSSSHVNGPVITGGPHGPQNTPIQNSGQYSFSAPVACGQGDIYASFTSYEATLFPENDNLPGVGILTASHTPLAEFFLSDMGFHGPTTYMNTSTNCWTGIPESGVATSTTLSCQAPTTPNTLTLSSTVPGQPVPGGVWTVTGPNGYHASYNGTFVGLATPSPLAVGTYTITLADASSHDAYSVAPYSTTWTVTNLNTGNCTTTVTPLKPDATKITLCDVLGSVSITPTAGIDYYIGTTQITAGTAWVDQAGESGLSGTVHVTAVAESGYTLDSHAASSWHFHLGSASSCTVVPSFGDCIPTAGVSNESVTLTFTNPADHAANVEVTGGSITGTLKFTVPKHATNFQYVIDQLGTSGSVYTVSINGVVQSPVDLSFDACLITVHPADPTVVDTTCSAPINGVPSVPVGGSITTDGNPNLIYTLTGGSLPVAGEVFPDAGTPGGPTISGLPGGQYVVSVQVNPNSPNYILGPATPKAYPVTVPLTPQTCGGTTLTPVVTSDDTCTTGIVQPQEESSKFTAAITYVVGGEINLPQQPGILVFTINNVVQTDAVVSEPNGGPYVVKVTLTDAAIADGYVLSDPDVSWTYSFQTFCPPVLAVLPWSATSTDAVCTASGVKGTITVTEDPAQLGLVIFTVTNVTTHATIGTVTATTTFTVPPGNYNVDAVPADTTHFGLDPNGGNTAFVDTPETIGGAGTVCGNLAQTGGTIGWLGFALAGGMLFLGIAFLYMKRRGHGTAQ